MEDMDMFVDLITNLFLTISLYELVPFILKYCIGKIYTEKQARKIAIINTIIVYSNNYFLHICYGRKQSC